MKCFLLFIGGVFFIVMFVFSETKFMKADTYDCQEKWYGSGVHTSEHSGKINTCTKGDRPIAPGADYYISGDSVHRVNVDITQHNPSCSYGGGPGNMGQMFIPVCWLPREWHRMHISERRHFSFISDDGANFRTASTKQTVLTPSQKNQLDRYVVDSSSVYYIASKMKGADPNTFEVIFPFGDSSSINKYDIARDNKNLYINGKQLPLIEIYEVKWLEIACKETYTGACQHSISNVPDVGVINKDIIYLSQWPHVALIKNVVIDELVCFSKGADIFCNMADKRYLLQGGRDGEVHFSQINRR